MNLCTKSLSPNLMCWDGSTGVSIGIRWPAVDFCSSRTSRSARSRREGIQRKPGQSNRSCEVMIIAG